MLRCWCVLVLSIEEERRGQLTQESRLPAKKITERTYCMDATIPLSVPAPIALSNLHRS